MIPQIAPADVARWRADPQRSPPLVVDVREPWELAICRIDGSVNVPLGAIAQRVGELPRVRPIICVCHLGARSQQAAMFLASAGFTDLYNLRGGIAAWADAVDPAMQRY